MDDFEKMITRVAATIVITFILAVATIHIVQWATDNGQSDTQTHIQRHVQPAGRK